MSETLLAVLETLLAELYEKLKIIRPVLRAAHFYEAPNKIKVATGMRRAGKTYFVYQHILWLLNQGIPLTSILYINFEDDRLLPLDRIKLAKLIDGFYTIYPENHGQKCYLFLDEIQNIEDWAIVIRRFHDSKNVEIFLTGSSSKLLSKELATQLRGRSLATEIWPYSFKEFIAIHHVDTQSHLFDKASQDLLKKYFNLYLEQGGFPEVIHYSEAERIATLQEYIDLVIYRDIVERYEIKNSTVVKYMILSMLHNVGTPFSMNKFYNDLKSQGYKINKDALYDYANYIEDAYLVFGIKLYDRSIRKIQVNPKKIYAVDPGIVSGITLKINTDLGKLFENIVYLDLRRAGYQVQYYLTNERYEIDFVVQTPKGNKQLLQVVWDQVNADTYQRESRALQAAEKELKIKGSIITLNDYLRDGIEGSLYFSE